MGANLIFDPKSSKLTKYDFGVNTELAVNSYFGVKHESDSKDTVRFGKFFFYFFHNASAYQTIGTEFSYDALTKFTTARLAFTHKFDEKVSSKFKINNMGHLDALLKLKLSETTTACVNTGFNIRSFAEAKTRALPLGISFDLKF